MPVTNLLIDLLFIAGAFFGTVALVRLMYMALDMFRPDRVVDERAAHCIPRANEFHVESRPNLDRSVHRDVSDCYSHESERARLLVRAAAEARRGNGRCADLLHADPAHDTDQIFVTHEPSMTCDSTTREVR